LSVCPGLRCAQTRPPGGATRTDLTDPAGNQGMLRFAAPALALVALAAPAPAAERPPNIVFILADDLGWTDLACRGSRYYDTHHPARRGFDEAIVSMGRHYNFTTTPPVPVKPGDYLADFLTDRAVYFIERHKDRPFFLYLPHFAVHVPLEAKAGLLAKYKRKPG